MRRIRVGREGVALQSPTNDSRRPYSEHLRIEPWYHTLTTRFQYLGFAANLNPPHPPRRYRSHIVYHKCHVWISLYVAEFFPLCKIMTTDVHRIKLRVIAKTNRHDMGPTIETNRRYST